MITFKKLLFEEDKVEAAQEVDKLLQTKFQNDLPKLYRASKREFEASYKVLEFGDEIREPKGSSYDAQIILDGVAEVIDPDIPKRFESKFASTEYVKGSGLVFGTNTYVAFPDENSDIVSFSGDTIDFRGDVDAMIADFSGRKPQYPKFSEMLEKIEELKYRSFIGWTKENWKDVSTELENGGIFGTKMLESIEDYFKAMKRGAREDSSEILFSGDQYLYVKPDFFDQYFTRLGGKWKLNPDYN